MIFFPTKMKFFCTKMTFLYLLNFSLQNDFFLSKSNIDITKRAFVKNGFFPLGRGGRGNSGNARKNAFSSEENVPNRDGFLSLEF